MKDTKNPNPTWWAGDLWRRLRGPWVAAAETSRWRTLLSPPAPVWAPVSSCQVVKFCVLLGLKWYIANISSLDRWRLSSFVDDVLMYISAFTAVWCLFFLCAFTLGELWSCNVYLLLGESLWSLVSCPLSWSCVRFTFTQMTFDKTFFLFLRGPIWLQYFLSKNDADATWLESEYLERMSKPAER